MNKWEGFELRKPGRPPFNGIPLSDPDLQHEIAMRIICGEAIRTICDDDTMPSERSFYEYMAKDEQFRSIISHAKELQQDTEVDRIVDMADAATIENWQVVKLQIHTRQWRASKLAQKKYGDTANTQTVNVGVAVNVLTKEKRDALIAKKRRAIEARNGLPAGPDKAQ